jgi:hypothetical protein
MNTTTESQLTKYQSMDLCELGSLASDYHKDVHGFRPRGEGLYANRDALIDILEGLDAYMASRRSTFAGRESMRADGWHVLETDPELIQRSIWLAEERDRERRCSIPVREISLAHTPVVADNFPNGNAACD